MPDRLKKEVEKSLGGGRRHQPRGSYLGGGGGLYGKMVPQVRYSRGGKGSREEKRHKRNSGSSSRHQGEIERKKWNRDAAKPMSDSGVLCGRRPKILQDLKRR